ncbi:MAG: phenylalanine--tRNA ligase subunit beta [Desulfovibrionaceae bacterium]|nr:phenylalanine--tRNA ligase subunit beta [Desulfovibrionaceae bacterium]
MLINLTWIKEFVPITAPVEDICTALTQRGFEVESVETPLAYLNTILIGEVKECIQHPNAENLSVCRVSLGEEEYTIVCGASNVRAGIRVPVATEGTVMPNGLLIKSVALRGVDSCGMICSQAELGIASESNGIWILPSDAPLGVSIASYYGVADTVLDISITPNRGDCLSILGIARELALYYSLPLTMPSMGYETTKAYTDSVQVEVVEECSSLYMMQKLRYKEYTETPAQMRFRLVSVGIRPISLVVDITNYVMIELGQPLHAFDGASIQGDRVSVQYAKEGEECTTLDGVKRELTDQDIVIAGKTGVLAIAGVMGCACSEIQPSTREIVLESAVFADISVRKTAKRLSLSSEASYRFERGVDRGMVGHALDRAISLLVMYANAEVSSTRSHSSYSVPISSILFRAEKARTLLGITIDDVVIEDMLVSLGCTVERKDFFWKITPPSYRGDLKQETDIIEEVARLYGIDTIPTALPSIRYNTVLHAMESQYMQMMTTKRILCELGLHEIISYSFISKQLLHHIEGEIEAVAIQNPLCAEYDVLRSRLLPSLLLAMQRNYNNGARSLALFEVASIFIDTHHSIDFHVKEKETVGILLSGYMNRQEWGYPKEVWDYRDAKGIVMEYIYSITRMTCSFKLEENHKALSPCVRIIVGGERVGVLGRIRPRLAKEFDARYPVWYCELSLASLYKYKASGVQSYTPIPSYPSMSRDITFIVEEHCNIGIVLDAITTTSDSILESVYCIDVYKNESTREKHITVRVILRDSSKTLTDKEADMYRERIIQRVQEVSNARV